ncbi:MAG: nucleotidyltransferase family protein [Leptolyngbyaceae cyanobacterium RU_5_1]|nr:nucleotidyltransferase family protein [Leptolyngbyaceae cyanobacterium RU_5_1]
MVQALPTKAGYQPQAEDTSIETDAFFFHLLRQRSCTQRLQMGTNMNRDARLFSLASLRQIFSHLSPQHFARKVALAWLQEECPDNYIPSGSEMTWIQDSTGLAALLHRIFAELNIPYYITGGVAAIAYGEPRTTRDVDIVLEINRDDIDELVKALEAAGFYVPGVEDLKAGRMQTLGVTHIETISRADLVVSGKEAFDKVKFERRRIISMPAAGELFFASPEDLILNKLRWGRQSQSEKQWRDVLGILKTQGTALDFEYLRSWTDTLGLTGELERALGEAGVG